MQNHTTKLKIKSSWKWMRERVKETHAYKKVGHFVFGEMANPVEHEIHERKICKRDSNHFFLRPEIDHLFRQCKCLQRRHFAPLRWHRPYRLLQHRVRRKMALPILTWFRLPTNFMPTIIRKCLFLASRVLLFPKKKQKKKEGGRDNKVLSSNPTWLLVGSWVDLLKTFLPCPVNLKMRSLALYEPK